MAYIAAEEYIRTFWWYVGIVPVFGLLALIFGQGPLQVIGMIGLLWPLSIPARALFTTSKSSRLFGQGVWIGITDDEVFVHGADKQGLKLEIESLRDTVVRQNHLLLRTKRLGFLPISVDSLPTPGDLEPLRAWITERIDVE